MINTTSTEAQRSLSALATVIFDLILLGENKDKVEIIVTRMLGPFNHIFFSLNALLYFFSTFERTGTKSCFKIWGPREA